MNIDVDIIDINDFTERNNQIGDGVTGIGYLVTKKATMEQYVIKVFKSGSEQFLNTEMQIMPQLCYPTLLSLYGITNNSPPHLIMEYLPNKSIQYYINLVRNDSDSDLLHNFDSTHKFIIILGIALGMRYLHSKDIAHRDLKPDNILLDSNFYPRICDFGFSKNLSISIAKSFVGTLDYMPVEIFNLPPNSDYDGKKADVYSFGMLLYSFLYEKLPLADNHLSVRDIITGIRPDLSKK